MSAGPTQLRAGGEGGWGLSQAELCDRHRETTARCVRSPSCRRRVQELPRGCRRLSCVRRRVLLGTGKRAREDHAARTTMCTAMQHPDCNGIGGCKQEQTFEKGLPAQRDDLAGKAVGLLRKASPRRCARPARAAPGWRAGVLTRVVSSASRPRRRALLVRSGGAPRCSTSSLSPPTSSPSAGNRRERVSVHSRATECQ